MTAAILARSAGIGGLALDHRGDDQHVVAREVLPGRRPEVDARGHALERAQLLLDEAGGRDRLAQGVGRREQEALDGELLLAGRAVARRRARVVRGTAVGRRRDAGARGVDGRDVAQRVALGDRQAHGRGDRGAGLQRREDDPVVLVLVQRVGAGSQAPAVAVQAHVERPYAPVRDDAGPIEDVADVLDRRALGDLHRDGSARRPGRPAEEHAVDREQRHRQHDQQRDPRDHEPAPPAAPYAPARRSRKVCNSTAAAWESSLVERLRDVVGIRRAIDVVRRSSSVRIGMRHRLRSRAMNASVSIACGPRSPRRVSGRPTTTTVGRLAVDDRTQLGHAALSPDLLRPRRAAARACRWGR